MELDFTKLSTKPKSRLANVFKWLALLFLVASTICFIGSIVFAYLDQIALTPENTPNDESVYLNLSYMLDELIWGVIGLGFYSAVLWFLSQVLEKVDQIVWLNASIDDRRWILEQRSKKIKNAKNQ